MQDAQLISQAGQVESLASDGLVSVSTGAGQPQKNMELAKFADSLGSSVPLQQTTEQVSITGLYARTSDGKMVELTKESVASVMAELSFPVNEWYYNTDLSNVREGTYRIKMSGVAIPEISHLDLWGSGVSFFANGCTVQYCVHNHGACVRQKLDQNDNWYPWQRIDNFGYNTLAELSSGVAGQMGVKKFMVYETEKGGDITTNINVNQGYYGGTIIAIASSHSSAGNATASEIKMIRCGYDGNNVEEAVVSSLINNANSGASIASYSANQDGYLVINANVRIARIKLFLF